MIDKISFWRRYMKWLRLLPHPVKNQTGGSTTDYFEGMELSEEQEKWFTSI